MSLAEGGGGRGEGLKGATPPTQKFRTLSKMLKKHSISGIQALNNFSFESEHKVGKFLSLGRLQNCGSAKGA